jgi:DNA-binding response OmpR family regulator
MATILIVDDSAACRKATAALLHDEGHRMLGADNAWRGLTILESMPVDLVILDLLLPGLNGFGFLKDIQQNRKFESLPVIVATALDVNPELWAQCQPQVKKWLNKGKFGGDELLEAVREVLPEGRLVTAAA